MVTLAVPVVVAEIGWVAMGLVDTLMVGPLGPEAIGAVGVGSSLFIGMVIFAMGILLGLDTLVSQAYGAGRVEECHRWLVHGAVLSLLVAVPVTLLLVRLVEPSWPVGVSIRPCSPDAAVPRCSCLERATAAALCNVSPLSAGHGRRAAGHDRARLGQRRQRDRQLGADSMASFGAPVMGVRGSAWATVLARVVMAAYLLGESSSQRERRRRPGLFETSPSIDWSWMRRLLTLGVPAASQITLEVGVFAAATALAGRLAPIALAAHQIAIHIAALSFMVPLGVFRRPAPCASAMRWAVAIRLPRSARAGRRFSSARASWHVPPPYSCCPQVADGRFTRNEGVVQPWACRSLPSRRSFSSSTAFRALRPAFSAASATRARQ